MRDEERVRKVPGTSEDVGTVGIISLGNLAAMNQSSVLGRVRAGGCNEQESMRLLNIAQKAQIFPIPGRNVVLEIEASRLSEQRRRLNQFSASLLQEHINPVIFKEI